MEYVSSKCTGHPKGCSLQTGVQKVNKNGVGKVEQSYPEFFAANILGFCWLFSNVFRREGGGQKPSSIVETTPFLCEISTLGFCLQPSRGPTGYKQTWDRIQQDFTALAPRCCMFCVGAILFWQKKITEVWVVGSCFRSQFWTLTKKDERTPSKRSVQLSSGFHGISIEPEGFSHRVGV